MLSTLLRFNKHHQRPLLNGDMIGRKRKISIDEAAKILNTTPGRIQRVLRVARTEGLQAAREIKWGKGAW